MAKPRGWQHGWQRGNSDPVATKTDDVPRRVQARFALRRGLSPGRRQHKEAAATFAEAREIKLARDAQARAERRGPTLHDYTLRWLDRYAGSGRDSLRDGTRREYRRLLNTFALRYFADDLRLRDLDTASVQRFVDWLTALPGRKGRLSDRSVANALTPLRVALDAAVADGADAPGS